MKMTPEHYNKLKEKITPIMEEIPLEKYTSNGLTPTRYRWDLLWRANLNEFVCKTLYEYLNDTHIDTALRKITGTK